MIMKILKEGKIEIYITETTGVNDNEFLSETW